MQARRKGLEDLNRWGDLVTAEGLKYECTKCGVKPGERCRRPSGSTVYGNVHSPRWRTAVEVVGPYREHCGGLH